MKEYYKQLIAWWIVPYTSPLAKETVFHIPLQSVVVLIAGRFNYVDLQSNEYRYIRYYHHCLN